MAQKKLTISNKPFHIDFFLLGLILLMAAISLIAIYGAIPITPAWINGQSILIKQAIWYGLGFITLIFLLNFGVDRLFTSIKVFYWILIFLLFLLILDFYIDLPFITPINGSRAWIILPGIGTIQPSEFMKIVLILMSANIIHEHNQFKTQMSFKDDLSLFYKILKVVLLPLI